jgi:hypothetical protein
VSGHDGLTFEGAQIDVLLKSGMYLEVRPTSRRISQKAGSVSDEYWTVVGFSETSSFTAAFRTASGVHPAVIKIALSAVAWFLAVA